MNEEFLTGLGLDKEISDAILQEYNSEKLDAGISAALKSANTTDETVARAMLDKEGLNIENLSERIQKLKEEHPSLFKEPVPRFVSSAEPKSTIDKKGFEKMTYRERLELFNKNPDRYKKLVE